MTYRVETCYHLIWICNIYVLLGIVSCENGNENMFSFWWYLRCVLAGVVAVIRDNRMVRKPLIHGVSLMQNDLCAMWRFSERVSALEMVRWRKICVKWIINVRNGVVVGKFLNFLWHTWRMERNNISSYTQKWR